MEGGTKPLQNVWIPGGVQHYGCSCNLLTHETGRGWVEVGVAIAGVQMSCPGSQSGPAPSPWPLPQSETGGGDAREDPVLLQRGQRDPAMLCSYSRPASPRPVRITWWKLLENGTLDQGVLVAIRRRHRSFGITEAACACSRTRGTKRPWRSRTCGSRIVGATAAVTDGLEDRSLWAGGQERPGGIGAAG